VDCSWNKNDIGNNDAITNLKEKFCCCDDDDDDDDVLIDSFRFP